MRFAALVLIATLVGPTTTLALDRDLLGLARGVYAPDGHACQMASVEQMLVHDGLGLSSASETCHAKVRRRTEGEIVFDQVCLVHARPDGVWRRRPAQTLQKLSPQSFRLTGPRHAPAKRRSTDTYALCAKIDPRRVTADAAITKDAPRSPAPRSAR